MEITVRFQITLIIMPEFQVVKRGFFYENGFKENFYIAGGFFPANWWKEMFT